MRLPPHPLRYPIEISDLIEKRFPEEALVEAIRIHYRDVVKEDKANRKLPPNSPKQVISVQTQLRYRQYRIILRTNFDLRKTVVGTPRELPSPKRGEGMQ